MIGKGGVGIAGERATWITTKGCFHDAILVGSNHSVHAVVSDTGWAILITSLYISKRNTLTKF